MQQSNWLTHVHEGMDVYDSDGDKVGTVREVYFGTRTDEIESGGTVAQTVNAPGEGFREGDSIIDGVAAALGGADDNWPEGLRERLLYHGYLRLDSGLLRSDRFVMGNQIAGVSDDRVTLNVKGDNLATR